MSKQGGGKQAAPATLPVKSDDADKVERGQTLHREFVGMVFALAIAEVAIQCAPIANAGLPFLYALPAFTHLALATLIIVASWVGWGHSKDSKSGIATVFSGDFLELLSDLWLVAIYFFIVKGVEVGTVKGVEVGTSDGKVTVNPSLENEAFWICIALGTYFVWDFLTKRKDFQRLIQRGWASAACAGLGYFAYRYLPSGVVDGNRVVIGDCSLAFLILLFRAMKADDLYLSKLAKRHWFRIVTLLVLFLLTLFWSAHYDAVAVRWAEITAGKAPAVPAP